MSELPTSLVNILITPAQQHNNQYPPVLNLPIPSQPTTAIAPVLSKVHFDNDANAGGDLLLPDAQVVFVNNPLITQVNSITFAETNFHPTSGLCVLTLITAENYQEVGMGVSFSLLNNPRGFYESLQPACKYTFVLTLSKDQNGVTDIVLLSKTVQTLSAL